MPDLKGSIYIASNTQDRERREVSVDMEFHEYLLTSIKFLKAGCKTLLTER